MSLQSVLVIDARRLAAGEKREDYASSDDLRTYYLDKMRDELGRPTVHPPSLAKQNADLRELIGTILGTFTDTWGPNIVRSQYVRCDLVEQWKRQIREER